MKATIFRDGGPGSSGVMECSRDGADGGPLISVELPPRLVEMISLYLDARKSDPRSSDAVRGSCANECIAKKMCIEKDAVPAYRSLIHKLIREAATRAGVPCPSPMFTSRPGGGTRLSSDWEVEIV